MGRFILLAMLIALLAGCQPGGPVRQFTQGETLATYEFSEDNTFEEGAYPQASLRILDDVYRIAISEGDNEIWWGQWGSTYSDVIIDADVTQATEPTENAFGVMCRVSGTVGQEVVLDPALAAAAEATSEPASEATAEATETVEATEVVEATEAVEATEVVEATSEAEATAEATSEATDEPEVDDIPVIAYGNGYAFLIQGGGAYAIMRSTDRSLVPLVNWTPSDKINQGPAENKLRAVCVGDYLAFYINGEFVADVIDTTYSEGQIGLAASSGNRLGVRVQFDNVVVSQANAG